MTTAVTDLTRPDVHLHIGAERLAAGSAGTFDHVNPVTGKVDKAIPMAGPAEVDRAVAQLRRHSNRGDAPLRRSGLGC